MRRLLAVFALAALACSGSPDSSGSGTGTKTSSRATSGGGGHGSSGGSASGGGSSGGSGSKCSPATQLPTPPGGFNSLLCPGSGDPAQDCDPAFHHCCEAAPGAGTSTCTPVGTSCPASAVMDWGCADPDDDCQSGQLCCAPGASLVVGAPGCASSATGMTSTTCQSAACAGIQLCTKTSECPSGMTCTPFAQEGNDVGGCT